MRNIERRVVLSVIGRQWPEHLYEMDYLKEGIGLRAMAQRDPLIEYQREGYAMFQSMMDAIREETVAYLFNLDLTKQRTQMSSQALTIPQQPKFLRFSAPSEDGGEESHVEANPEESGAGTNSSGKDSKGESSKAGASSSETDAPASEAPRSGGAKKKGRKKRK
jgi:preprotein translocase subunit SecA